jgi:hypothetical protein
MGHGNGPVGRIVAAMRQTPSYGSAGRPAPPYLAGQLWAGLTRQTPAFSGTRARAATRWPAESAELDGPVGTRRQHRPEPRSEDRDRSLGGRAEPLRNGRSRLAAPLAAAVAVLVVVAGQAIIAHSGLRHHLTAAASPESAGTDPGSLGINDLAFSPASSTFAIADANGSAYLWSTASGRISLTATLFRLGSAGISSLAFSPDGKTLATASINGPVRLWNAATGQSAGPALDTSSLGISDVAFSPDGKTVAIADTRGPVRLWNAVTGRRVGVPLGRRDAVCVAFSPDGKLVATCGADGPVRLWDVATGQPAGAAMGAGAGATYGVSSVEFSPDGKTLAVADGTDSVHLLDPATGRLADTLRVRGSDGITNVEFSPDGKALAAGDSNGVVHLWTAEGRSIGSFATASVVSGSSALFAFPMDGVDGVAFSPDSKTLVVVGEGSISQWTLSLPPGA